MRKDTRLSQHIRSGTGKPGNEARVNVHEILFYFYHHRTVSVQIEPPQEPGFYGDLDLREVAPVVDSNRGDFDVAGVLNAPMPPDRYHLVSLLEAEQHRCSTDEKRNDLQQKMNAF